MSARRKRGDRFGVCASTEMPLLSSIFVMNPIPVCLFEDREECILGVKLLVLSAQSHEPNWHFHAFIRNFRQEDQEWLSAQPNVTLRTEIPTDQKGWNVKPSLLHQLLTETGGPILWCDSDIILAAPVSGILDQLDESIFVATEEYGWGRKKGSKLRTAGWDLVEARPLAKTVNSCFMRMNRSHLPLLSAWETLLLNPNYVKAQEGGWDQRPLHLMGDQDVLTALLASPEHAYVPVHLLKSGRDIAQCFEEDGYTVQDRLMNFIMHRVPPLIHAQGGKPWKKGQRASYQQLSPYNKVAAPYLVSEKLPDQWTNADSEFEKKMEKWFANDPNLCGLIPALARTMRRVWHHCPRCQIAWRRSLQR